MPVLERSRKKSKLSEGKRKGQMVGTLEPFSQLPESARRQIGEIAEENFYTKGRVLFHEGGRADHLWVIQGGWVRLVKRGGGGRDLTLDLLTPKDILCGLSAFSNTTYMATAVTATPLAALRIPANLLKQFLGQHAAFASQVMEIFSARFHHLAGTYAQSLGPVESRIASVLLRLDEDFGRTLPVTRKEVAHLAGTTVETAIRITRRMQDEGILQISRGRLLILRPEALRSKSRL